MNEETNFIEDTQYYIAIRPHLIALLCNVFACTRIKIFNRNLLFFTILHIMHNLFYQIINIKICIFTFL